MKGGVPNCASCFKVFRSSIFPVIAQRLHNCFMYNVWKYLNGHLGTAESCKYQRALSHAAPIIQSRQLCVLFFKAFNRNLSTLIILHFYVILLLLIIMYLWATGGPSVL
jgi:high-affinity Fe2+/Pb2+ permease